MKKIALVIGASGQVGSECVKLLCSDQRYAKVIGLVRTATEFRHDNYKEVVIDFDKYETVADRLVCNDIYCALGQTSRLKALFYKVDYLYPLALSQFAKKHGASRACYVSALGANASSYKYYFKIKGKTEEAINALGFETFYSVRPSMIYGVKDSQRALQKLSRHITHVFGWAFIGPLRKYIAVSATAVAATMIEAMNGKSTGNYAIESDEIQRMAQAYSQRQLRIKI